MARSPACCCRPGATWPPPGASSPGRCGTCLRPEPAPRSLRHRYRDPRPSPAQHRLRRPRAHCMSQQDIAIMLWRTKGRHNQRGSAAAPVVYRSSGTTRVPREGCGQGGGLRPDPQISAGPRRGRPSIRPRKLRSRERSTNIATLRNPSSGHVTQYSSGTPFPEPQAQPRPLDLTRLLRAGQSGTATATRGSPHYSRSAHTSSTLAPWLPPQDLTP